MAAVARTRLDQVPLGSNDPLWSAPGSVHALPGRVAVEADPLGGGNGGRSDSSPQGDFEFETSVGEGLTVTTGAGSTVGVGVRYVEV